MTEQTAQPAAPEPPAAAQPDPGQHGGVIAHLRQLIAEHVSPEVADARIKAENAAAKADRALAVLGDHASAVSRLAALVKAAADADPALASLAPEAEAILADTARIAEALHDA